MSDETPTRLFWTTRRAVGVILALLAAVPFALYALRSLNTENDIATWLPAHDPHARVLDWFGREFGVDHGLLASWDGSTLNDPRVEAFAEALAGPLDEEGNRQDPLPGIENVRTPREVIRRMIENQVPRDEAVKRSTGLLVGTGPLKVRLTETGRERQEETIARVLAAASEELNLEIEAIPPAVDPFHDEALARAEARREATGVEDEFSGPGADDPYPPLPQHEFQLRWNGLVPEADSTAQVRELLASLRTDAGEPLVEESFFAAGDPVAVVVTLTEEGEEKVNETIDLIRRTAETVGIPSAELHMGGSPVGRAALNHATVETSWNTRYPIWNLPMRSPLLMSALVGLGTSFIVLRSVRLALLVIITALYVAMIATALVPATGRNLNMVLLVMPNLLIVLTASGAIHVANYWWHAASENPVGAIDASVRMAWQPCLLASVTTAIGLTSLLTSVLSPVREFGEYSAVGCLLSVVAVLLGFPALLQLWRGEVPTRELTDTSFWKRLGHWLYRHGTLVSLACLAIFVGSAAGLRYFRTETKVIKYFPEHTSIIADYRFLEENLAGVVPVDVVIAFDVPAEDEALDEDLTAEELDAPKADNQLDAAQRMELVRHVEAKIAEHPEISGTLSLADFRPAIEPPGDNAPRLARVKYARTVHGIEDYLAQAESGADGGLTARASSPLQLAYTGRAVDIPQGAELWRVRAQVAVLSDLDYTRLTDHLDALVDEQLADTPGATHVVTGMVPLFLRTQQAVLESLIRSFALAFAVIAVIMMILLRNPLAGLLTMLPNVMPVGVVFGLISWAGIPVDIGTMITASVALGIAIDGTLHLLTWFRDGLRHGMSREDAIALGLGHCGPAMWQTSAAIGLGMLMLATAELLLISRFGWLMAALIAAALFADIILLPALLSGPLGTLIARNNQPTLLDPSEADSIAAHEPEAVTTH